MLRLFPALPSSDKLTPASSLVARQNDSNMRIVAGSTTLPEGNIIYPTSFTLTSFTDPTTTCLCSNSTSYDVSVTTEYTWSCGDYDPDEGSWSYETRYTSYSNTIDAGAAFNDNGFTPHSPEPGGYNSCTITARKLTVTILRPHTYSMQNENLISKS